ncbi:MAG: hypothetical protein SO255_08010, partial [Sodaliphilus sp.]|nr:hypothetical protein [Sodaliphilus sp.]
TTISSSFAIILRFHCIAMYKDTQSNPKATSLHLKFIFSLAHKKILAAFFEQSGFLVWGCA